MKNLLIVESPAKAKTIEKYLGKDYRVLSSYGHIRDLPKKGMSVDIEHNFEPTYDISADKKKTVAALKKATKEVDIVWLASDEDREGEAIAWHLKEALKLPDSQTRRITFNEITQTAVQKALEQPRDINYHLVNAQQARRILDRIVGYELSPLLWRKVQPGLSAGRVQSVAVRLVVDRERELQAFTSESSFKITAEFTTDKQDTVPAKLKTDIPAKAEALELLGQAKDAIFSITSIEKKPSIRQPSPPFTTSTLQQTASHQLGFSPKQTMRLAQLLYEAGHITYMRTDSLNISEQALAQAKSVIESKFGPQYYNRRTFKTKSKGAQEAHEAIRPTDLARDNAGDDERARRLYQLIRERALASQMAAAQLEKTVLVINSPNIIQDFISEGEIVIFDGFFRVMKRTREDSLLPDLHQGETLQPRWIEARENYSRGPARYSEASLIKALEEQGIGRPSTYAPTLSTIQDRQYVIKGDVEGQETSIFIARLSSKDITETSEIKFIGADRNKLQPTSVGMIVTDFLTKNFNEVVDYAFTARLESEFDEIADGNKEWQAVLQNFYGDFHMNIDKAQNISRKEAAQARSLGKDPTSGKPVIARLGRYGPMVQIGEAEDEVKPRFAPLPEGEKLKTVTLEAALKAFDLPRIVGTTTDGQEISASRGRFGPYVKYGSTFVSIKDYDPLTIDEVSARKLITAHQDKLAKQLIQSFDSGLQIKDGRFGPYVTNGKKNAKIPKNVDPKTLSETDAKTLLEARVKKQKK